jgi:hypothetical protein
VNCTGLELRTRQRRAWRQGQGPGRRLGPGRGSRWLRDASGPAGSGGRLGLVLATGPARRWPAPGWTDDL